MFKMAKMATLSDELHADLEDMVQCLICIETMKEPRSLPCLHSFCTKCLEMLLGTRRYIRCPCCSQEAPVFNGVRGLPLDFRINSLFEVMSKFQKVKIDFKKAELSVNAAVKLDSKNTKISADASQTPNWCGSYEPRDVSRTLGGQVSTQPDTIRLGGVQVSTQPDTIRLGMGQVSTHPGSSKRGRGQVSTQPDSSKLGGRQVSTQPDSSQLGGDQAKRRPRHPDSHQVFVGNMPHKLSETDLKNYFDHFGTVVEVRINKKTGSTAVPNYGFVVFEDDKTVQSMLSHKGGFLLPTGHRLNVEEKKKRGNSGHPSKPGRAGHNGPRVGRPVPGGPQV